MEGTIKRKQREEEQREEENPDYELNKPLGKCNSNPLIRAGSKKSNIYT